MAVLYPYTLANGDCFEGELYLPLRECFPSLLCIVIGGSQGGLAHRHEALELADQGCAALALAYFRHADLPSTLEEIPPEYFAPACEQLRKEFPERRLIAIAHSRGAECALLLAAHFPTLFEAVVATSPSAYAWASQCPVEDVVSGGHEQVPTWTRHGRGLPFVPTTPAPPRVAMIEGQRVVSFLDTWLAHLNSATQPVVDKARIPAEQITCPVRLFGGEDDHMWPSAQFISALSSWMPPGLCSVVTYPEVGHVITNPGEDACVARTLPDFNLGVLFGGRPAAIKAASEDRWRRLFNDLSRWQARADLSSAPQPLFPIGS